MGVWSTQIFIFDAKVIWERFEIKDKIRYINH